MNSTITLPENSTEITDEIQRFILSRIGRTISKVGLLPESSFMQIRINLARCCEIPGGMVIRKPSKATCEKLEGYTLFFINTEGITKKWKSIHLVF